MLAQLLDIGNKIPGGVLFERSMRRALSRSALIEEHDAIGIRIVKLSILRHQPAAGPAVQKDDRLTFGIAALFVVNLVNLRDSQAARVVGFDWGVKSSDFCHAH